MSTPETKAKNPITLKIKFKSGSLDQFIERYSVDVSKGSIFLRTKEPLPVGTQLKFEFQLQDGSPLLAGEGTVVWNRTQEQAKANAAPGMGVRFDKLNADSQRTLERILDDAITARDGGADAENPIIGTTASIVVVVDVPDAAGVVPTSRLARRAEDVGPLLPLLPPPTPLPLLPPPPPPPSPPPRPSPPPSPPPTPAAAAVAAAASPLASAVAAVTSAPSTAAAAAATCPAAARLRRTQLRDIMLAAMSTTGTAVSAALLMATAAIVASAAAATAKSAVVASREAKTEVAWKVAGQSVTTAVEDDVDADTQGGAAAATL